METEIQKVTPDKRRYSEFFDDETGYIVRREFRDAAGRLHSENDEPSVTLFCMFENEIEVGEEYHQHGVMHRIGGPAKIEICVASRIHTLEVWMENGQMHRENGEPALIVRREDCEDVQVKQYWIHGKSVAPPVVGALENHMVK